MVPLLVRVLEVLGRRLGDDRGQTTAEYVLVILGAAAIAVLVMAWAGGTGKIGELLDRVFDSLLSSVG